MSSKKYPQRPFCSLSTQIDFPVVRLVVDNAYVPDMLTLHARLDGKLSDNSLRDILTATADAWYTAGEERSTKARTWPATEEKFYANETAPNCWQVVERVKPRDSQGSCTVTVFADCGSQEHSEAFARFIARKANGLTRGIPLESTE